MRTKIISSLLQPLCDLTAFNELSRSSEGQRHNDACLWKGYDLSTNVHEYEVNRLTNEKVVREKRYFNANCLRCRTPA